MSLDNLTQPNYQARLERLTWTMEDGGDDIILDLRKLNFQVDDPMFDAFGIGVLANVKMEMLQLLILGGVMVCVSLRWQSMRVRQL